MRSVGLNKIINNTVVDFEFDGESIYFDFKGGIGLAIHNERLTQPSNINDFKDTVLGKYLLEVNESDKSIEFLFDDETSIKVFLDDESYNGPEALVLEIPGEPIVVWN
ncbi:MAG: hypothetical protein OQJ80_11205 [Kangiella sp.]|nr:hypothetical protein [Kangiella sp.]